MRDLTPVRCDLIPDDFDFIPGEHDLIPDECDLIPGKYDLKFGKNELIPGKDDLEVGRECCPRRGWTALEGGSAYAVFMPRPDEHSRVIRAAAYYPKPQPRASFQKLRLPPTLFRAVRSAAASPPDTS